MKPESLLEELAIDMWNTLEEWKQGHADAWSQLMELHEQMYLELLDRVGVNAEPVAASVAISAAEQDPHARFKAVAHLN